MSKLPLLLVLAFFLVSSIITPTPAQNGQISPEAVLDTCNYRATNDTCLDDDENMQYNVVNNDQSICKAEYFGVCIDDMSSTELTDLETFKNLNK